MERRPGKEIAQDTGNISNEDKRIAKSITRRMAESFDKTLKEQEAIINEARKNRPQAEYFKAQIDKAFKRTTQQALDTCVKETNKIQGRNPEAEAERDAIYQEYERKVNSFTKLRDELKKAAEK